MGDARASPRAEPQSAPPTVESVTTASSSDQSQPSGNLHIAHGADDAAAEAPPFSAGINDGNETAPAPPAPPSPSAAVSPEHPSTTDSHGDDAGDANTITIGTRKSALALVQTEEVRRALAAAWPGTRYRVVDRETVGDKNQSRALHSFGAKALWTQELEVLLETGACDLVVHSLKDIPTQLPPNLQIGAIFPREDPRDALVLPLPAPPPAQEPHQPPTRKQRTAASSILAALPAGAVIGTSSVRRSAQLARAHPHLRFASVRGNVGTRLSKLDDPAQGYAALVLAAAGLKRLGLGERITAFLSSRSSSAASTASATSRNGGGPPSRAERETEEGKDKPEVGHLYAVGQGALGIECRRGDARVLGLLARVGCERTTHACLAERSLLRALEGGCSVPIGVETAWVRPSPSPPQQPPPATAAEEDAPGGEEREDEDDFWTLKGDEMDALRMQATVVSLDGRQAVDVDMEGTVASRDDADEFGRAVAGEMVRRGAGSILEAINLDRKIIGEQGGA